MFTLAVLNQKGGVGKSTLATNLAACAHVMGQRTLLIDLDRQGSSLDWGAARKEGSMLSGLAVCKWDKVLAFSRFKELTQGYEYVVLDGAPRMNESTRSAAVAADAVLIPVQSGPFDVWATGETIALLDEADEIRKELKRTPLRRLFVLNRANARTVLARQTPQALRTYGSVAPMMIQQRIVFAEAAALGESVVSTEPQGEAAREVRSLYQWIRKKKET